MSLTPSSTPSFESESTLDSSYVTKQIRQYERESYETINKVFERGQIIDQLVYTQFRFGQSDQTTLNAIQCSQNDQTTLNAIQCSATRIRHDSRKSVTSSFESAVVEIGFRDSFSFSDVSSTKNLIAKKKKNRAFAVAMFGFVFVLTGCIIPVIIFLPRTEKVCNSPACIKGSADMMGKMNTQNDP